MKQASPPNLLTITASPSSFRHSSESTCYPFLQPYISKPKTLSKKIASNKRSFEKFLRESYVPVRNFRKKMQKWDTKLLHFVGFAVMLFLLLLFTGWLFPTLQNDWFYRSLKIISFVIMKISELFAAFFLIVSSLRLVLAKFNRII